MSKNIRIKICGITSLEDALFCCDLGVDALGFVFYEKSKRYINPSIAKNIIVKLPSFISTVGLFVNNDKDFIKKTIEEVPIDIIQFHGDEDEDFCSSFMRPYIKSIRVSTQKDINNAIINYTSARSLLFDSYNNNYYGGTGEHFDWDSLIINTNRPWILAGGLNSNNVMMAINKTKANVVDVSSGVEDYPGKKNINKVSDFIKAIEGYKD